MNSLCFNFGTSDKTDSEGKGIDWLLDPFLQKKVAGQAGFDYEIVQTRPDIITEILNNKYQLEDVGRVLQSHTFYNLFLSMNVKINEPDKWILNWARFEFEINGANLSILSFAPEDQGVRTEIERYGSREFNLSLTGELEPVYSTAKNDRKKGWTIKYENRIAEVIGHKKRTVDDKISLEWEIYNNKAIRVPENNIGETTGVYATALVAIPRRSEAFVDVKIAGDTVHRGSAIRSHGIIELASRGRFNIEPTI